MRFSSLSEILRFAVAKEESSVLLYRSLREHVKDANIAAVLEAMAHQEEKHVESLRLELFKLGCTIKDAKPQEAADPAENEVVLDSDKKIEEMTALDFMRLGIQKERAAFALYAELMVLVEDMDSRKMFLELAEEEMRHAISLEREVEILMGSQKK